MRASVPTLGPGICNHYPTKLRTCVEYRSMFASVSRSAGEAEHALAEDVAHDVRRAAHDRVAGRVRQAVDDVVPQGSVGAECAPDEVRHPLLVLRAEAFRRLREPRGRLLE